MFLNNLEKIAGEIAELKKIIITELKVSPNGKHKVLLQDFHKNIQELSPLWDNISAAEEIRRQREK